MEIEIRDWMNRDEWKKWEMCVTRQTTEGEMEEREWRREKTWMNIVWVDK